MNSLEKSILKTVAFGDIFNYPLTPTEIYKWLFKPEKINGKYPSLFIIKNSLENSDILKEKLSNREAFYYLKGRRSIIYIRKQNNNLAESKFSKIISLVKIYRFIPFVRMIAVCNSLAISNANENSDIDLFIIAKKDKIWLARFFTIIFVKFFDLRPKGDNNKDTFCLSFFIDEDYLNIKSITINNNDIYLPHWIQQLVPIYNPDYLYEKFMKANEWYKEYLPNGYNNEFVYEVKETYLSRFYNIIISSLFSIPFISYYLHNILRKIQILIIDRNLKSLVNLNTKVIVNNQMLKFHDNDRRDIFFKQWKERLSKLI